MINYLFENIEVFSKGNEMEVIIELDNHQYFQKSVPDKSINIMSLFSKLLKIITRKQII